MAEDVYDLLASHLDNLTAGFPKTESGVEIRILRHLFTKEDAALALHLTVIPEEPRVIARRAGIPVAEAAGRLVDMEKKGLIIRWQLRNKPALYTSAQYLVGFWEAQVNRLSADLVQDVKEYDSTFFNLDNWSKAPQFRTIPINKSVSVQNEIMPYEMAEELMRASKSFTIMNCICRQGMHLLGKGCNKPEESCLALGGLADYYAEIGRGRKIGLEETLEILRRADESGLVLQPSNAKSPIIMCMCCGCCCQVLNAIKRDPKPGRIISSPFFARHDKETCKGCGICTKRCQMEALHVSDKKALLNVDRCIGCGLCVTTCTTHSLSLVRKPQKEQAYIPINFIDTALKVAQARGKLGMGELISLKLRSILDRLLAPK